MRTIVLLIAAIAVFSSSSTSAFAAGAALPNNSTQSTIPSGPPNIQVQSATIALAPQCQPGKTVLTVAATYTNTGGALASNALSLVAADVTNPNFGRMDFMPALGAGQTGTMTLNVAYLQPNPEKMVGQHTFGVGLYNKPPMVNVKVTVPAAFCGFNPSLGLSSAMSRATSATAISGALVNPPNLPTPTSLKYATDYNTCSQHLDQITCESDIEGKAAFLSWDLLPCTGSNCVNNISGYNIYEVPRGWQPPRPIGVLNTTAVNPGLTATNPVTSTGSVAAAPGPNAPSSGTAATTAHISAPSNPQLMSAHVNPIQNPTLVLATGSNPRFAQMLPPHTVGRCFSVAARWSTDESLYSEPICIASNAHVGYVRITLDPAALGTVYGGIHCAGTPPFAHPGGSIIAGDSDTNGGWCPYYQGVLAFDLTGSGFNPAIIAHASLTYNFLGFFNADGSTDSPPYQSGACSTIHDTIISVEKFGDPHSGLVETDAMIDQLWPNGGPPINVTDTVNRDLYGNTGMARFVIGRAGGMSEPLGTHCYSEWGNFHLVIDAYGTH